MGLFDSLKKSIDSLANEVAAHSDDIKKGLDILASESKNTASGNASAPTPQSNYRQPESAQQVEEEDGSYEIPVTYGADCTAKMEDIISRNFADWEVRRNVPASALKPGCHPACTPVQFLFCRDGAPLLAVVLVRLNNYRGRNVLGTKDICDEQGIRYVRFYHEYPNEEAYVVDRIKERL